MGESKGLAVVRDGLEAVAAGAALVPGAGPVAGALAVLSTGMNAIVGVIAPVRGRKLENLEYVVRMAILAGQSEQAFLEALKRLEDEPGFRGLVEQLVSEFQRVTARALWVESSRVDVVS